ncbi:MAG: M15 family metallopeptidase [Candidatus Krumholzibacteriia bacterium]|nr:M15 family metallopeptidase [bacterium]MCB9515444.1 M15 family metallopeptidase [Candidatus Latescibacterota bacterium]
MTRLWPPRSSTLLVLLALSAAWTGACAQSAPPLVPPVEEMKTWNDSVTVAGQRYAVPEQWRGRRVGARNTPPPPDLVPLPAALRIAGDIPRLRMEAFLALRAMAAEAALDSITLRVDSGYRSPDEQAALIAKRLAAGREFDEIVWGVAPPGYSEHMLGTTVDLALGGNYEHNPAYHWLKANAANYGWRETYPPDSTGTFPWEPWHWRYVGVDELAAERARAEGRQDDD